MNATLFIEILKKRLLPFIAKNFPDGHRFMQDNNPKHRSILAQTFYRDNQINWWKTPAESPDLNPIESLWHELKEHVRRAVKPKTKDELIAGIKDFWKTVGASKCTKYIRHLRKVVPKVIQVEGEPTGY